MTPNDPGPRDERLAVIYLSLAVRTSGKGPMPTRDRLLLLAASSACRAGWTDEADTCRQLVLAVTPRHLVGDFESMAEAMRDSDYQHFDRQLRRLCPQERAEHLAELQGLDPIPTAEDCDRDLIASLLRQLATADR